MNSNLSIKSHEQAVPKGQHLALADPIAMDIDSTALGYNFQQVRELVGEGINIIPSIKGDGYGIGAAYSASVFKKAGAYSVATGSILDASAIRASGNDMRIHLFPGITPDAMKTAWQLKLTPTVYSLELAVAAAAVASRKWGVFIKVDAGFGRLGVPLDEAKKFVLEVAKLPNLEIEGIFTHVPFGDDVGLNWAMDGLNRFDDLVAELSSVGVDIPISQSLASSGVLRGLKTRTNTVCVGHLMYGGLGREKLGEEKHSRFRPAIRGVRAKLIHMRRHENDTLVGSSGKIKMRAGSVTGTVPIGLHEGYRSAATGQQSMMIVRGKRVPVLFVSQEYSVIDLSGVENARLGDDVFVFGKSDGEFISIEEMAAWQGQSALHVVMNMNCRIPLNFE